MSSSVHCLSTPLLPPSPTASPISCPSLEKDKKAAASWNKRGEVIGEGKAGERLKLHPKDSRVYVRIFKTDGKSLQKIMAEAGRVLGFYVKLDEQTYLYKKSLQKRLHVEPSEIDRAIANQRLFEFLVEQAQQTVMVLHAFEEIMQKVEPNITENLSKQVWMAEIQMIIKNRHKSPTCYKQLYLNEKEYHLGFNHSIQKVVLCTLENITLDKSYTQTSQLKDLLSQHTSIFQTTQPEALKKIDDKNHFLTFLYNFPSSSPIGIQIAPTEWIGLQDNGEEKQGYVLMEYEGNYEKCVNPLKSPSVGIEKINLETFKTLFQLSSGVHFLHTRRWIHGNIEPKSIFYITKTQGGRKVQYTHLGGFKHAHHYDPSTWSLSLSTRNRSTKYIHPADLEAKLKLGHPESVFELEKKQDVFSLGIVFYLILTGSFPYEFQKIDPHAIPMTSILDVIHRAPKKDEELEFPIPCTLNVSKAPKEYRDLIWGMLRDDYRLRFSMDEVHEKMESLVTRITKRQSLSSFKEELKWKKNERSRS